MFPAGQPEFEASIDKTESGTTLTSGSIGVTVTAEPHTFDIKFHNVRDMVEEKSIVIIRIPSEENVADALTKALGLPKFSPLVDKMGFTDEA